MSSSSRTRNLPKPPFFTKPLNPTNLPVARRSARAGVSGEKRDAVPRILIFCLGASGDVLMASPLASALRRAHPDAYLCWVIEHTHRYVMDANPYVDEVIVWDGAFWQRAMEKPRRRPSWLWNALRFAASLRRRRFDTFISFHAEQFGWVVRAAGAKTNIGIFDRFPEIEKKEHDTRTLYQHVFLRDDLPPHRTDQHLVVLKPMGVALPAPDEKRMVMGFVEGDAQAAERLLIERFGLVPLRLVCIAPMTTWVTRCWPAARYADLIDTITSRGPGDVAVLLLGSAAEKPGIEVVAALCRASPAPSVACGVLNFREMAALIARANVLISGDTGPMHVAGAVGTPFVSLFGATPADGRAPLIGRGRVLIGRAECAPCDNKVCLWEPDSPSFIKCMKDIEMEAVLQVSLPFLRDDKA